MSEWWEAIAVAAAAIIGAFALDYRRRVPKDVPASDPKPIGGSAPPPGGKSQAYPGVTSEDSRAWVQIPAGSAWSVRDPARAWVTQATYVAFLEALAAYAEREEPTPILVLDASRKSGGPFPPHRSHREGRDIDLRWQGPEKMPTRELAIFLEMLVADDKLQAIFLDHGVQRDVWDLIHASPSLDPSGILAAELQYPLAAGTGRTRIRHWPGHKDHLHVRYRS